MGERILGVFGNDTLFGRIMNKCGVIIATNIMFVIFSIPFVTIGASMSAMSFVMLKMQKDDEDINPFKLFWVGFKNNFMQSTIAWILIFVVCMIAMFDLKICEAAQSSVEVLKYPISAMSFLLLIFSIYLFQVIAAFKNRLGVLFQNTFFLICRSFIKAIFLGVLFYLCYVVTYLDRGMAPLYAFIWFFFGFGALAHVTSALLYKEFEPYLDNE